MRIAKWCVSLPSGAVRYTLRAIAADGSPLRAAQRTSGEWSGLGGKAAGVLGGSADRTAAETAGAGDAVREAFATPVGGAAGESEAQAVMPPSTSSTIWAVI
jgi:hypothetical protein